MSETAPCSVCSLRFVVRKERVREHADQRGSTCRGSGLAPAEESAPVSRLG